VQEQGASSIDEYVASFPEPAREKLAELRTLLRELVPQAEERISYRMPAMFFHGLIAYFGAFAHHLGFYPGARGIAAFEAELAGYRHARGSIQFPLDQPLPRQLIERIVKFNLAENLKKRP